VEVTGDRDGTGSETITLAKSAYYNLLVNSSTNPDVLTLGAALDVNGNLTITQGALAVSGSNYGITLAGDWSNAGTFTAGSGTVTLDGGTQRVSGQTTFCNLARNNGAGTLYVDSGTKTVTGALTRGRWRLRFTANM